MIGIVINPTQSQKLDAYNKRWKKMYLTVTSFLEHRTQQELDDAWDELNHLGKWTLSAHMSMIEYERDCRGCDNVRTVTPYKKGQRVMLALIEPCEQCGVCIK